MPEVVNKNEPSGQMEPWVALIIALELLWVAFAVLLYIIGLQEDPMGVMKPPRVESIIEEMWSFNIAQALAGW